MAAVAASTALALAKPIEHKAIWMDPVATVVTVRLDADNDIQVAGFSGAGPICGHSGRASIIVTAIPFPSLSPRTN